MYCIKKVSPASQPAVACVCRCRAANVGSAKAADVDAFFSVK